MRTSPAFLHVQRDPRPISESNLHHVAVELLRHFPVANVIWYHAANGESRSARTGAKLARMGVRPGVADICIVLPGGRAAFLELKRPKSPGKRAGVLSEQQRKFRTDCEASGALYAVADTPEQVATILKSWGAISAIPAGIVRPTRQAAE